MYIYIYIYIYIHVYIYIQEELSIYIYRLFQATDADGSGLLQKRELQKMLERDVQLELPGTKVLTLLVWYKSTCSTKARAAEILRYKSTSTHQSAWRTEV
jgi:hypothetical protein